MKIPKFLQKLTKKRQKLTKCKTCKLLESVYEAKLLLLSSKKDKEIQERVALGRRFQRFEDTVWEMMNDLDENAALEPPHDITEELLNTWRGRLGLALMEIPWDRTKDEG